MIEKICKNGQNCQKMAKIRIKSKKYAKQTEKTKFTKIKKRYKAKNRQKY